MVQIGETVVSFDLFEETFCCDLGKCLGACCIEGDAGAPLEEAEIAELEELLPAIRDELNPEARRIVDQEGVAYIDQEGELVAQIVDGRQCVFAYRDEKDGCLKCLIERAFRQGRTSFMKPISCHLYPVRLERFNSFTAVNYHRWELCRDARCLGSKLNLPLFRFLKEPLIRRFGAEWYAELERAHHDYEQAFAQFKNK